MSAAMNPITIDTREHGIFNALRRFDVPLTEQKLEFGDAVFDGQGAGAQGQDAPVTVGIERKRLGVEDGRISTDLINSMQDRRLSGTQLRGMATTYDHVYIFIEGMWRADVAGEIEVSEDGRYWRPLYHHNGHGPQKHRVNHRQVMSYITTLELKGCTSVGNKFVVRRTLNMKETAAQYVDLWHWFNNKKWSEHTSHFQFYAPGPEMQAKRGSKASFVDPIEQFRRQFGDEGVVCWKVAAQLPGVDTVRARSLAEHFRTVEALVKAGPAEWQKVEGVGPVTAQAGRLLRARKDQAK